MEPRKAETDDATELEALKASRVDGVDLPATRRTFLVMKSKESELMKVEEGVVKAAQGFILELAKHSELGALALPEPVVASANVLGKSVGFDKEFTVKAFPPKKEEDEDKDEMACSAKKAEAAPTEKAAAEPVNAAVTAPAGVTKSELDSAIAAAIAPVAKSIEGLTTLVTERLASAPVAKSADKKPASAQPQGQDEVKKSQPKKMGEGMFTGVVFGGDTNMIRR